jgi:hypothetical protein
VPSDPVRRLAQGLLDRRLDERCRELFARLREECPELGREVPPPGEVAAVLPLDPRSLRQLLVAAAAPGGTTAAGREPQSVVWTDGDSQLLVDVAHLDVEMGDGLVTVVIPVSCDQTQEVKITVAFAVGRADRPAGLLTTTHDRPGGPALIVDRWGEALIAFAWSALLAATLGLSGASGVDADGDPLVTAGITASANGLEIHTMAKPPFTTRSATPRTGRVP